MNTGIRRFFIAHMIAYVIAMPWAIAAIPMIFIWKQDELLTMKVEEDAIRYVVKLALVPFTAAFVLPHLFCIPWVRSARKQTHQGRLLLAGSSALLLCTGLGLSVVAWAELLKR